MWRMNGLSALPAVLVALTVASPAQAARTASDTYTPASTLYGVHCEAEGPAGVVDPNPCFEVQAGERYVHVMVADSIPLPVAFVVQAFSASGLSWQSPRWFCDQADITLPATIPPYNEPVVRLGVYVTTAPLPNADPAEPPCPGVATSGTVTATFS